MLSHLHQLFNVDTCDIYIHTLRWQERPLQCHWCHGPNVDPEGPLSLPTGLETLLEQELPAHLQRPHEHAPFPGQAITRTLEPCDLSVVLACSARRIAREAGVCVRTKSVHRRFVHLTSRTRRYTRLCGLSSVPMLCGLI